MRGWQGLTVVMAVAMGACADEEPRGDGSLDSKKVSELTESEQRTLCEWLSARSAAFAANDEEICTRSAADVSDSVADCEQRRDDCLKERAARPPAQTCDDYQVSTWCTLDVRTLKECFTDLTTLYEQAALGATCANYQAAVVDEVPDSCANLTPACAKDGFMTHVTSTSAPSLPRR